MDTNSATSSFGSVARTISKILRFRRNVTSNTTAESEFDHDHKIPNLKPAKSIQSFSQVLPKLNRDDEIHKLKPSKSMDDLSQVLPKCEDEKPEEDRFHDKRAMESLIANLFTSISAIKAAYAQLQVAQSPYDPDTIQSADRSVVTELMHISELKHGYFKHQIGPPPPPPMAAQVQEHRNLIKTFQITTKKLESDLQYRDSKVMSLQAQLMELDRQNRSMESRLHPGILLSSLDGLHLSGLDPTHFLEVVRDSARSVRSFVKLMVGEMESAGWDLGAAARSIQPDVHNRPTHKIFAFESFVSQKMLSNFHCRDFGLAPFENRASWEPQKFYAEFTELKSAKTKHLFATPKGRSYGFCKFCRARYLTLVHPKMEASFFGNLDQRELVSSGRGFPESEFFAGFAEMARRVWLLHCLFFSFDKEMGGSIFQLKRGMRFSEVYMESVLEEREVYGTGARPPVVRFTVMPGFSIGRTVIQSKVYISG